MTEILKKINEPSNVKKLKDKEVNKLAEEVRQLIIDTVNTNGGHLSSNLGVVELTIALLRSFDVEKDKVFFDCGHQSYTYKILTDRKERFKTLGKINGLESFQNPKESKYDVMSAGHTSTSLSVAEGLATAREQMKEDYHIVPVIGDGALTGGLALEALMNISDGDKKMIIILNDNGMSISSNITSVSRFRHSSPYNLVKNTIKSTKKIPIIGRLFYSGAKIMKETIKHVTVGKNFFESLGLEYVYVPDGNDISKIQSALEQAKTYKGTVVVHVITKKGKGLKEAEQDNDGSFHGLSNGGISNKLVKSWSEIISDKLLIEMDKNEKINIITPAMTNNAKLIKIQEKHPDRFKDVGIAEQHALTLSYGMTLKGLVPVVSIYSSFLQRAYDQIVHDISRNNANVKFIIDRASISGTSGATHHGLFDIPMLLPIPDIVIGQPRNNVQAEAMVELALEHNGPFAIRINRNKVEATISKPVKIKLGTWEYVTKVTSPKFTFISIGEDVEIFDDWFKSKNIKCDVIDARFIKPLDMNMIKELAKKNKPVVFYAKEMLEQGIGEQIKYKLFDNSFKSKYLNFGFPNEFIKHGNDEELLKHYKLDKDSVLKEINKLIK